MTDLKGTSWIMVNLDGEAVLKDVEAKLEFSEKGMLNGNTGCNSFGSPYTITGNKLKFGPIMASLKGCMGALDKQERLVFGLMEAVESFQFTNDGQLELLTSDNRKILARPAK